MVADCDRRHPLKRSGTHQAGRALPALDPDFFRVDERQTADLIRFATQFSRHLQYYATDNQKAGDWTPFFNLDLAAVLADLSEQPVSLFQSFSRDLRTFLEDPNPPKSDQILSMHFKLLFYLPFLLVKVMDNIVARLPSEHTLRRQFPQILSREASDGLARLLRIFKGAHSLSGAPINQPNLFVDTNLVASDYNIAFDDSDERIQLPSAITRRIEIAQQDTLTVAGLVLSQELIAAFGEVDWNSYYTNLQADTGPFEDSFGSFYQQIYDALNHNLIVEAFERVYAALELVKREAASQLLVALTQVDDHPPHYGLWLAFLRLFQFSQQHLNTLTKRHLEYYYQDILQLCRRTPEPDQVHILFELNRNVRAQLLPAVETQFKAGKDNSGREVLYQLDQDLVVNSAKVESLKSMELITTGGNLTAHASPMTDSRDGQGETRPKGNPAWKPFGPGRIAPLARVGFAISDRQLLLREGTRTITIRVEIREKVVRSKLKFYQSVSVGAFKASLTTTEGWLEISPDQVDVKFLRLGRLQFKIILDGEAPAIMPFDPQVHGDDFRVTEPVIKIEFSYEDNSFQQIRDLTFADISLQVDVNGIRNIFLQNDLGPIDSSTPFQPFGPSPEKNATLILGCTEVFQKALAGLALNVVWEKTLTDSYYESPKPSTRRTRQSQLTGGRWDPFGSDYDIEVFDSVDTAKEIPLHFLEGLTGDAGLTVENIPYSNQARSGFIRLELESGFDHRDYLRAFPKALIDSGTPPAEPYTPKIMEILLGYKTETSQPEHFLHLYPFGFKRVKADSGRLFPELSNTGELYIGIRDLEPPQRLTLLFQTLEGSANPLKLEQPLQWDYLSGNQWVELEGQFVDDKTSNLTGSGIIGLAIPEEANEQHELLPAGLIWLRMTAHSDVDALNDILGIHAQAATASFMDQDNDSEFLDTPLSAGTISKLKVSLGALKKIEQPYDSYGGRPLETSQHFYIRASERLRHKDRAVTMWDYERLVLEGFPGIYKVKCISHTALERDPQNNILADNEIRPGHVLVVPIPSLHSRKAVNPLRPYTDRKTIREIDQYLRLRLSPFVQLEVQNPKFEEVQVKFLVAFKAGIADITFYQERLNEALISTLSPWTVNQGTEISFGGRWYKSTLIDFVEEQPFVDYVKDFEMYHKADITISDGEWNRVDSERIEASTARSILVSHPKHDIQEIR